MNILTLFTNLLTTLFGASPVTQIFSALLAEICCLLLLRAFFKLTGAKKVNTYFIIAYICLAIFTVLYYLLSTYPNFLQGGIIP